jgi:hypothetical protein
MQSIHILNLNQISEDEHAPNCHILADLTCRIVSTSLPGGSISRRTRDIREGSRKNSNVSRFAGDSEGKLEILLTIIPSGSQEGYHVALAFQKSDMAAGEPRSTHGLPPTESLNGQLVSVK